MNRRGVLNAVICSAGLLAMASPLSSAWALTVTTPGLVLMVDGQDADVTVKITAVDGTFPVGTYDFGFVSGGAYTKITSLIGSYTFAGGTAVDFALRNTKNNTIFDIADPANYATQTYSGAINPTYSQNPVVTSPYYHTLVLTWDLNKDGVADTGFDLVVSTPLRSHDGVAPIPVPVPAAIGLLGSGLVGLFGVGARRRNRVALASARR